MKIKRERIERSHLRRVRMLVYTCMVLQHKNIMVGRATVRE